MIFGQCPGFVFVIGCMLAFMWQIGAEVKEL